MSNGVRSSSDLAPQLLSRRTGTTVRDRGGAPVFRWWTALLALVAGLGTAFIWTGTAQGDDWASLWIAGRLLSDGQAAHLYDRNPADFAAWFGPAWEAVIRTEEVAPWPHPFVHMPGVAGVMSVVVHLGSFSQSLWTLTAFSGAAAVVLVAASWTLWTKETCPPRVLAPATAVLLLSEPFAQGVWLGQTSALIMAGAVTALAIADRRPVLSGVLLATVTIVKLTPAALIVVLLLWRGPRRRAGLIAGGVAMLAAAVAYVGNTEAFRLWLDTISWMRSVGLAASINQSPQSWLLEDHRNPQVVVTVLSDLPTSATVLPKLFTVALLALVAAAALLIPPRRFEILAVGGFAVLTVTGNVYWVHYAIVLVPVLVGGAWAVTQGLAGRRGARTDVGLMLLALPLCAFYLPLAGAVGPRVAGQPWAVLSGSLLVLLIALALLIAVGIADYNHRRSRHDLAAATQPE